MPHSDQLTFKCTHSTVFPSKHPGSLSAWRPRAFPGTKGACPTLQKGDDVLWIQPLQTTHLPKRENGWWHLSVCVPLGRWNDTGRKFAQRGPSRLKAQLYSLSHLLTPSLMLPEVASQISCPLPSPCLAIRFWGDALAITAGDLNPTSLSSRTRGRAGNPPSRDCK